MNPKINITILLIFLPFCNLFGNYSDYFPIRDGLKWIYLVKENNKQFEQYVICRESYSNNSHNYDFYFETNSIRKTKYFYKLKNDLVYLIKTEVNWKAFPVKFNLRYTPLFPVFSISKEIDQWSWKGTISYFLFKKNIVVKFQIKGKEQVQTKLGKLECIKISAIIRINDNEEEYTAWYAKSIGLIKFLSPYQEKEIISFYR